MGLDMFLHAKRSIWENELRTELNELASSINKGLTAESIVFEALYWRKAYPIHDWFVKNVQAGNDDCGYYNVTVPMLNALVVTIEEVQNDRTKAEKLLPPKTALFGSVYLDEQYWHQLNYTKTGITDLLSKIGDQEIYDWRFEYHSSW